MVNLQNTPSAGPLTAADLAEARRFNAGTVLHLHRATLAQCPPCTGNCNQGRACSAGKPARVEQWPDTMPSDHAPLAAEACTDMGADECRPPASRIGIALVVLPWVLAVIGWAVWTRWPLH